MAAIMMKTAGATLDAYTINPQSVSYEDLQIAMKFYWNLIEPTGHWKDAIETCVEAHWLPYCEMACEFFTGTKLRTVGKSNTPFMNYIEVEADGYYAGPCN